MSEMRLQKLLSECGIASRRKAEEMIIQRKVKVNGHLASLGDKANIRKDVITVDGKRIALPERMLYIMLNKPRGYVTTMNDEKGRKCVADLMVDAGVRVFPVGRLDRDSEGLLILTNDGEFANATIHPAKHIPKVYRVTLRPAPTDEQMQMFREGILLEGEKRKTAPADIVIIFGEKADGLRSERVVAEIVLYEGRNRQIRRMFESIKIEVARLRRVAIGNVKLGMLPPGKWRELEPREVQSLRSAALGPAAEIKPRAAARGEERRHGVHRPRR
ncbi:MAG TPA: pseudouridine synthase [Ruminococcaceae bacterium]|nr:pseudouridine synthase [Oscillospiraceae bacterium]